MSRIQLSQPSYANGFARSRGESAAPDLYPNFAHIPALGAQGNIVYSLGSNPRKPAVSVGGYGWSISGWVGNGTDSEIDVTTAGSTSDYVLPVRDPFTVVSTVIIPAGVTSDSAVWTNRVSSYDAFLYGVHAATGYKTRLYARSCGGEVFVGSDIRGRGPVTLGVSRVGPTSWEHYIDGVYNTGRTDATDGEIRQGFGIGFACNNSVTLTRFHLYGTVLLNYIYLRDITSDGHAALGRDPLLPFRRRTPVFYSVPSSGGGATYQGEAIDGLTLGESTASRGIFRATAIDGIGMGEGQSGLLKALLSVSDGIKISELSAGRLSISANGVDGIALSDAASAIAVLGALASDGVSISDTGAGDLGGLIAEALDGFKIGDTASSIATLIASAIDGAAIGDSASSIASMISAAIDGIIFSDSAISGSFEGIAADGIKLTDSSLAMLRILKSVADGIAMSDTASGRVDFTVTCADGATFGETIGTIMTMLATASDTFNLGDIAVYLDQQIATITLSTRSPSITFTLRKPTITFN